MSDDEKKKCWSPTQTVSDDTNQKNNPNLPITIGTTAIHRGGIHHRRRMRLMSIKKGNDCLILTRWPLITVMTLMQVRNYLVKNQSGQRWFLEDEGTAKIEEETSSAKRIIHQTWSCEHQKHTKIQRVTQW